MLDYVATMAKAHLIASEGTVRGLLAFQKALTPAYFELMSLRMPLDVQRSAIATEQNYMDNATADHQKFIQLLQQLHVSGSQDKAAMERVNSQLEGAENSFKRHAERQAALHQEQVKGQLAAAERLSELAQIVSKSMPDTLIAARQELELPIDPVEYSRLYAGQQDAATRAMREFLENLRNQSGTSKRD